MGRFNERGQHDVDEVPGGHQIFVNGAVEWALHSIMEREVICLPSEAQLRDRLGVAFRSLERDQDRYRCTVKVGEDPLAYEATDPADAYGFALLDLIEEAETYLRVLVDEL